MEWMGLGRVSWMADYGTYCVIEAAIVAAKPILLSVVNYIPAAALNQFSVSVFDIVSGHRH